MDKSAYLIKLASEYFKEILDEISEKSRADVSVIIVGSASLGNSDRHSDVDGKMICWKKLPLKKYSKIIKGHKIDFEITTIDEFCINPLLERNDWSKTSPFGLFAVSRATVIYDPMHRFKRIQDKIDKYYPKKVWKNLLLNAWRGLLEDGRYNLQRDVKRKKEYMSHLHSSNAIWHSILLCFYLNKRYYPTHHQWLYDEFMKLPLLSLTIKPFIDKIIRTTNMREKQKNIQRIIEIYSKYLKNNHIVKEEYLEKWWLIPWR